MREVFKHIKKGFTLVEVLAVVAILGILSAAGYSSLNNAIANSRLKDAIVNTRAFVESMSLESKRLHDSLCIVFVANQMQTKRFANDVCEGDAISTLELVAPVSFYTSTPQNIVSQESFVATPVIWTSADKFLVLSPKLGLNEITEEGVIALRYGNSSRYGAVLKSAKKNRLQAYFSVDGGASWVIP
ncbi:MAG: prepilin-type N-terminal cleavage/methylation domain-containing protein [Fibrobacter sp.]|jgi:prepilin-type N-terminal cleavage/methylation domain-containing protein|nr:prepilin-type N-terminal cleavage/methylation domain-containing protein [Fibrobacter sp.]